eukprot:scaffold72574_cov67-Phaeocystis_antarctica.AAC.3
MSTSARGVSPPLLPSACPPSLPSPSSSSSPSPSPSPPPPPPLPPPSAVSLGTKVAPRPARRAATSGWRPPRMSMVAGWSSGSSVGAQ